MKHMVLGIGYHESEYETVRAEWRSHGVAFQFVNSIDEAVRHLQREDYVCITICSGRINSNHLDILRAVKPVPIVVLSPESEVSQRVGYFQRGAADFIMHAHNRQIFAYQNNDAVQYYLDSPNKAIEPLTIFTTEDIYFCLEYRLVRVREQEIELTPFEFAALHLLLENPKRTLTFETISVRVWGQEYIDNPPKAVSNLISRLRNKLKIAPDVKVPIKSIHGVGYKYDAIA